MQHMKNLFLRNPSRALAAIAILVAILALPILSSVAHAQVNTGGIQSAPTTGINSVTDVFTKIKTIFNILFWALILLAAIFIIMAAFSYLTAGGDPEKIKTANHRVIYAAVAVVVGVLAKSIPNIVCSFLDVSGGCSATPGTG